MPRAIFPFFLRFYCFSFDPLFTSMHRTVYCCNIYSIINIFCCHSPHTQMSVSEWLMESCKIMMSCEKKLINLFCSLRMENVLITGQGHFFSVNYISLFTCVNGCNGSLT